VALKGLLPAERVPEPATVQPESVKAASVMALVAELTRFPYVSWISTVGAVVSETPAVPVDEGCTV
jgi:hypothetical protein